jgi:hypothetical protein
MRIYSAETPVRDLLRLGRKKKPKWRALHSKQRYGRINRDSRTIQSRKPRRWDLETAGLPHMGQRRSWMENEMACVRVMHYAAGSRWPADGKSVALIPVLPDVPAHGILFDLLE